MSGSKQNRQRTRDPLGVRIVQYLIPISFSIAMGGIIVWIVSLIELSHKLEDIPSASVGISIVAIPVFLLLLSVFWYVFLAIIRNQDEDGGSATDFRANRKR